MQCFKWLVLSLILLMTACDSAVNIVDGSGTIKTETREVGSFKQLVINGMGEVVVTQGDTVSLTIEADDNLLELLTSDISGDTLTLGVKSNTSIGRTTRLLYTLTVTELTGIELKGSAGITVTDLSTEHFTLTLSGSGNIVMTGSTNTLTATISGAGNFDGSKFSSRTAAVSITGTGIAQISVMEKLDAAISGTGSIVYRGTPEVTRTVTGAGTIQQAP